MCRHPVSPKDGAGDFMSMMNLSETTRTLAMLVRLNLPLADGLSQIGPPGSRWHRAAERLRQGEEPEQAFSEISDVSPLFAKLVASALSSPVPAPILESLSRWLETSDRVRAEARLALIYPLVLACCLLVEAGLLMLVAVPAVITPLLAPGSFGAMLSSVGQMLGLLFLIASVVLLWSARGDRIFSLAARLPSLNRLVSLIDQALWARAMAALLRAGVELPYALSQAPRTMVTPSLREQFTSLSQSVSQGTYLSRALSELPTVDSHLNWAVAAGESQENLALTLERAACQLEGRLKAQAALLLKFLEPLALVLVGVLTALLLLPFWITLYAGAQSLAP